ncbi:tyrosine-type recombinase/integrase [Mesorhizobium sp. SP-1A]|uniref:tyrosine-type recombinase/integrase n=1 Tax=Mesorhizobium sp. SP-1A TaxID=3077840 RepID=UPI0028F6EEFA|nr:tyrosine-type recombinase/integrase [Mesorhizobium sp. SP-1A]
MASIVERKKKDGTSSFLAQIVIKRDGRIIHRENKTFGRRREAVAWGKFRESELAEPGAVEEIKAEDPTLAKAIEKHERELKHVGRTKGSVLKILRTTKLAQMRCSEIRSQHIVALARELSEGRAPATVSGYMTFLNGVFDIARPAWGYPLDAQAMKDALVVIGKQGLTGRSKKRERRPTLDEMNRLMEFFAGRKVDALPMLKIVAFALFSTRRQSEITRLLWSDLDEAHSRILVRDAKDPKGAAGNHIWTELTPEALRIIQSMPRSAAEIFPFNPETVSYTFREACLVLGITTEDMPDDERLHFHDLRHEGVSRLFEMGRTIPQAASVSGHRSWQNLQRYAHLRQTGDKFEGWKWLEKACA